MSILDPPSRHEWCDLPGWAQIGTLAQCTTCRRWHFTTAMSEVYAHGWKPVSRWRKVRWYHFGLRKRIRTELPARLAPAPRPPVGAEQQVSPKKK